MRKEGPATAGPLAFNPTSPTQRAVPAFHVRSTSRTARSAGVMPCPYPVPLAITSTPPASPAARPPSAASSSASTTTRLADHHELPEEGRGRAVSNFLPWKPALPFSALWPRSWPASPPDAWNPGQPHRFYSASRSPASVFPAIPPLSPPSSPKAGSSSASLSLSRSPTSSKPCGRSPIAALNVPGLQPNNVFSSSWSEQGGGWVCPRRYTVGGRNRPNNSRLAASGVTTPS